MRMHRRERDRDERLAAGILAGILLSAGYGLKARHNNVGGSLQAVASLFLSSAAVAAAVRLAYISWSATESQFKLFAGDDRVYVFLGAVALAWVAGAEIFRQYRSVDRPTAEGSVDQLNVRLERRTGSGGCTVEGPRTSTLSWTRHPPAAQTRLYRVRLGAWKGTPSPSSSSISTRSPPNRLSDRGRTGSSQRPLVPTSAPANIAAPRARNDDATAISSTRRFIVASTRRPTNDRPQDRAWGLGETSSR